MHQLCTFHCGLCAVVNPSSICGCDMDLQRFADLLPLHVAQTVMQHLPVHFVHMMLFTMEKSIFTKNF